MGTIQIKKYERTVTVGKGSAERQKVKKTYCKKHDMEKATDEDKLACAAAFLPSTFTDGTKFEKYHTSRMFPVHTDRSDEADNG